MDAPYPEEKEIHLRDYWYVVVKRRILILIFLAVTVALTLVFSFAARPVYEATAKLVIEKEVSTSPITGERTDFESLPSNELTFNTHVALIKSNPVIETLVRELKLDVPDAPETLEISAFQRLKRRLGGNIRLLFNRASEAPGPEAIMQGLRAQILRKINIAPVRNTRILGIAVQDMDPENARRIADTLAEKYIQFNMANRLEASQTQLAWMNDELYKLKKRLEDDEKKFLEYKQAQKMFSIEGKQKMIEQKIIEFNDKYLAARNERQTIDAKLKELEPHLAGDLGELRSLLDQSLIDNVYGRLIELEVERSRLAKVFKPKHPQLVQIDTKIDESRKTIRNELHKAYDNLKTQRSVLYSQEKILEQSIAEFEKDALETGSKEMLYNIMQRNVNTSQNLYDTLVARIKESNILQTSDTTNIRIVEKADLPLSPIKPNKKRNLMLALLLGLAGGVGLAFFLEYLDQTVRTDEDVRNHIGYPVLAVIPVADPQDEGGYY